MSAVAKRLPAKRATAPILRLDQAKVDLARCETAEQVQLVESKARLMAAWAREQRELLKSATLEEAEAAEAEAAILSRESGATLILAAARRGELLPPKSKGGRGRKTVAPGATVSKDDALRCRKIAAAAPELLDVYLSACEESGGEVTRTGFLAFAAAHRKALERDRERKAAAAELDNGGSVPGEPDPEDYDSAPGEERCPFERAADELIQSAKLLQSRAKTWGDPWSRMRDGAVEDLRELAGRLTQGARERRESLP